MMCHVCGTTIDRVSGCQCGKAALPPVRSEPLFGGKWTDSDLKAFATARCREIRRKYTREQAQSICEEMAQLWDLGNDYLTPNTQAEVRLTRKDNHE